jgi:hypothetical protein
MNLTLENRLNNFIPLMVVSDNEIVVSKRNNLYIYNLLINSFTLIVKLPTSNFISFCSRIKLLTRLLRLGVRLSVSISNNKIIVVFNKQFYEVDILNNSYESVFDIPRGNRPLNIANVINIVGFENTLYFGEYFSNFKRDSVNVYKRLSDKSWKIVYTFPEGTIEHIHAIVPDKYRECLWILTGDFNIASGIWMAKNNFNFVEPILQGSQKFRSCVAFPLPEGILYATDSQFEKNSIRLMRNQNEEWVSDFICYVNGPVIYGCKVKNNLFFSTSVEGDSHMKKIFSKYLDKTPGPGIEGKSSTIVGGNLENGFKILNENPKDNLPFILFQFGAITFPTGDNQSDYLFSYNIALKNNDLETQIFQIN